MSVAHSIGLFFISILCVSLTSCGPYYGDALGGSNMNYLITKADTVNTRLNHSFGIAAHQPNNYGKEDVNKALGLNYQFDYKVEGFIIGLGASVDAGNYEFNSFREGFGIENLRSENYIAVGFQGKLGFYKSISPDLGIEFFSTNLSINGTNGGFHEFKQTFKHLHPIGGGDGVLTLNAFLASGIDYRLGKNWWSARLMLGTELPALYRNKFGFQLGFQLPKVHIFVQANNSFAYTAPIFPLLTNGTKSKLSSFKFGARYYL